MKTRQWILKREPVGGMSIADFECREIDLDAASLAEGQVLVRHQAFLCTPAMRGWIRSALIRSAQRRRIMVCWRTCGNSATRILAS